MLPEDEEITLRAQESEISCDTASSANCSENKWRAKMYQLNTDGGWDDLGTGYSQIIKEVGELTSEDFGA